MLLPIASIALGLALLVWSADRFVIGAAALARNLGVPPLLVGLTVVGFGTSAPEILVSTMAALQGNTGIAIGNAVGSNIANIALILGTTALVAPLSVQSDMLRREYPLLLLVTVAVFLLLLDRDLDLTDGLILLGGLVFSMSLLVRIGLQRRDHDPLAEEIEAEVPGDLRTSAAITWFAIGLIVLVLSSRLLVWGAVEMATALGVSDLVIGLTIVAIGTSLPELAASIASALKGEPDLAIGNVVGSNLWNLLAVLGVPALLAPGAIPAEALDRDMLVMLALTLALFVMGRSAQTHGTINRIEGGVLLSSFIAYQSWVIWQAHTAASS
ncbi:MAG: calcium/sodium antiporter [Chromatiaceae bacterium]|nr:calcium/sodium antiporter [Gammaproteobacteria bacterium]MCP5305206.1 calcium/sodium antiporter [Chromatiaceae bacterium]MCP5315165.1 calcium/sodium antiporter [Chromatiaceae bacterium]